METFLDFYENIPVPLQGMNADNYEIYVMYRNGFMIHTADLCNQLNR